MGKLILVSGATRSGKSSFAEEQAEKLDKPVAYLATAEPLDSEMQNRIKHHQDRRNPAWKTFEETYAIDTIIKENQEKYPVWVLDCITLYVSNLLFAQIGSIEGDNLVADYINEQILQNIDNLISIIKNANIDIFIVTNELGWGLVPPDPISRLYRDIVGRVNQKLACAASEVYIVMLGIPVRIKP